MMTQSRLEKIVEAFTDETFTSEQKRCVRLACEDIERETRHGIVELLHQNTSKINRTPREKNEGVL